MRLREKTGKREYAFILMGVLLYSVYQGNVEMVEIIVWPFLSFVAAAAGIHIYDKSTSRPNLPQQQNQEQGTQA